MPENEPDKSQRRIFTGNPQAVLDAIAEVQALLDNLRDKHVVVRQRPRHDQP